MILRVESGSTAYLALGEAELAGLLADEPAEELLLGGGLSEAVVGLLYGGGAGPWAGDVRRLIRLGRRPYEVRFTGDYRSSSGGNCEVDSGHGYRRLHLQPLEMPYWFLREQSPPELVEYVRWFFLRGWHYEVCSWMRDAGARRRVRGAVEVLGVGSGACVMVRKRGSAAVRAHLSASGLVLGGTPDAFLGDGSRDYGRAHAVAPDVRMGRWETYLGGSFMRVLGVREGRVEVWRSWDAVRAVESGGAVVLSQHGDLDCPVLGLFEWGPVPTRTWGVSVVDSGGDR